MTIEKCSICRQQFAKVFANCFCAVHKRQLEFANLSLLREGCFTVQDFSVISVRSRAHAKQHIQNGGFC